MRPREPRRSCSTSPTRSRSRRRPASWTGSTGSSTTYIAVASPLEFLPSDEFRRQLDVNVVGQVAVTQAFLPALRRAKGRVVFIGSIAGRSALPFLGPYAASKHALEAVADSLRLEGCGRSESPFRSSARLDQDADLDARARSTAGGNGALR